MLCIANSVALLMCLGRCIGLRLYLVLILGV